MHKTGKLRILIADDHELIRRGIRDLLSAEVEWQIIAEARDGLEAVRLASELKPDLMILDLSMPHIGGSQAARELGRVSALTKVIVLTMHDSEKVIREVLRSGARGFVLKTDADRLLGEAIEVVSQGRYFFTSRVAELLLKEYLDRKSFLPKESSTSHITQREKEILALLASGMTSRQIAIHLGISTRTAESHRHNINRKLSFNSIADLVRYAIHSHISVAS